jgi:hypothetical protein
MLALWSDIIGIVAGVFLMIPAAKDNVYRFKERLNRQREEQSPWPGLRKIVAGAWKEQRDAYSAFDSACIFLGGLGLMASFSLKIASY